MNLTDSRGTHVALVGILLFVIGFLGAQYSKSLGAIVFGLPLYGGLILILGGLIRTMVDFRKFPYSQKLTIVGAFLLIGLGVTVFSWHVVRKNNHNTYCSQKYPTHYKGHLVYIDPNLITCLNGPIN